MGFAWEGCAAFGGEGSRGFPLAHCIDLRAMLMCALAGSRAHASLHVREAFPKRYAWGKALRTGLRHIVSEIPCCRMRARGNRHREHINIPAQYNHPDASHIFRLVLDAGESTLGAFEVAVVGQLPFCPLSQLLALLGVSVTVDTLDHCAPDE